MMILAGLEEADFTFLVTTLDLTRGNLNRHMEKLESAGYLKVKRSFKGKVRNTSYQITQKGSKALAQYWEDLDAIRRSGQP
jgi:DNA-binding MarR family transcriptional regulator